MASLIGQHQVTTFTSPVNGMSPIDGNTVRGNDNTIKTAYDAHDNDAGIHFQDSTNAARPVAGTVGRKWLDNDTYRVFYDDGTDWQEIAYLPASGGTVTGNVAVSGTVTVTSSNAAALAVGRQGATDPALQVDASTASSATGLKIKAAAAGGGLALSTVSSGANENLTIDAKGSGTITLGGTSTGGITLTRATTLSAGATVASGQTLTLTGATVTGAPTWAASQAITLATAAQPNVTSLGTLTALSITGALTIGSTLTSVRKVTETAEVSSATTIHASVSNTANVVVVTGIDHPTVTKYFMDVVVWMPGGTAAVVTGSTLEVGTPAARTYTVSGNNLQLEMASSAYDVVASSEQARYAT